MLVDPDDDHWIQGAKNLWRFRGGSLGEWLFFIGFWVVLLVVICAIAWGLHAIGAPSWLV